VRNGELRILRPHLGALDKKDTRTFTDRRVSVGGRSSGVNKGKARNSGICCHARHDAAFKSSRHRVQIMEGRTATLSLFGQGVFAAGSLSAKRGSYFTVGKTQRTCSSYRPGATAVDAFCRRARSDRLGQHYRRLSVTSGDSTDTGDRRTPAGVVVENRHRELYPPRNRSCTIRELERTRWSSTAATAT